MDPGTSPENKPPRKSETVKIGSVDSDSSPETNRSSTGCDTKLIDVATDNSHFPNKESSNNLIDEDTQKYKSLDDFPAG